MANRSEELSQINISEQEKEKVVAEVVRHVLFKTHHTKGCPIKREELTQLVTRNYDRRSLPALIINEARQVLDAVFGYELKELQRSRASNAKRGRPVSQQGGGDAKSYVLVSKLQPDIYKKFVEDKKSSHLNGFAFVVIGVIQLSGGTITEENLWHHLKRLGLYENNENHPNFGNLKNSLDSLVQRRYLQKEKLSGPEGNSMTYALAERSLDESVASEVKAYIAKIANKDATPLDL